MRASYPERQLRRKHLREVRRGDSVPSELCPAPWVPNCREQREIERRLVGALLDAPWMRPAVKAILGDQSSLGDRGTTLGVSDLGAAMALVELFGLGHVSLDALAAALERRPAPRGSPTVLELVGGVEWLSERVADAVVDGYDVINLALVARRYALRRRRGSFVLDEVERQQELELAGLAALAVGEAATA